MSCWGGGGSVGDVRGGGSKKEEFPTQPRSSVGSAFSAKSVYVVNVVQLRGSGISVLSRSSFSL